MKHGLKIVLILMTLFYLSQIFGLYLFNLSIDKIEKTENGTIEVKFTEPPTGRPEIDKKSFNPFIYVFSMIIFGTIILLLIIKLKWFKLWKGWFFLAILLSLIITLSVFLDPIISIILATILTFLKLYKPNIIIHNITELFIYSGITIMLAPLFSIDIAFLLLIAISIYDAIAVWKLKHMITLAKAQAEQKMFSGLLIPYSFSFKKNILKNDLNKKSIKNNEIGNKKIKSNLDQTNKKTKIELKIPKGINAENTKTAILGGGDIAFPMIFSGSIMTWLIEKGISQINAYFYTLIVVFFSGIGLFYLFLKSEKDKFYPAMPFISFGCFIGFVVLYFIMMML